MQMLHRQAAGAGIYDAIPGVDVIRDLDEMEGWFHDHRKTLGTGVIDNSIVEAEYREM